MTDREEADFLDSLATDPTTGVSYAMVDENDGLPEFLILHPDLGTYEGPFPLPAVRDVLGTGWMNGADFDAAGTLWFYYGGELASTIGAFGEATSAVSSGEAPDGDDDGPFVYSSALAVDPGAVPVLAETGTPVAGIAIGGFALLAGGLLSVLVLRRRPAAE